MSVFRTLPKNSEDPQQPLFVEDFNEALQGLVSALGGSKAVGSRLFPDLSPDAGARRVLDALNPDRPQQLAPTQVLTLLKWGREAECHGAMMFLAEEAGYMRPVPRNAEDAKAQLQRDFIDAIKTAEKLAQRLQK